jgi:hypothetical protein
MDVRMAVYVLGRYQVVVSKRFGAQNISRKLRGKVRICSLISKSADSYKLGGTP